MGGSKRSLPLWERAGVRLLLPHALRPLVVAVREGFGGHDRLHPALGQLFIELFPDERILVRIFDLILGAVLDLLGVAVELHRRMERQVARRAAAGVEMLVEPLVRRHEHAALVPRRSEEHTSELQSRGLISY